MNNRGVLIVTPGIRVITLVFIFRTAVLRLENEDTLEGATSRFAHLEKLSLNFSSSSFVIRVNLLHP